MDKKINDKITIKGIITARVYDKATGKLKREYAPVENLITTVGRNVFARLLSGDATYSGEITHGALGDDATAVANSDTTLGNEVYRNATASATQGDNIAYVTFFYDQTEVTGTFNEFGNFIDGAAGADTGQLWTHVNVSWTKTNTEILVVDCQYTKQKALYLYQTLPGPLHYNASGLNHGF